MSEDAQQVHLALCLLDLLVINCGYPMHLAVSRREFLNKLVYRFPPNAFHDPLDKCHHIILALLKKWTVALSERSRHHGDFGNIRLMASLLRAKGFPSPDVRDAEIDAIIAHERVGLRTKEELEAEERLVLETKLEELLNRGTPGDLRMANELMKRIVGYTEADQQTYSKSESQIEHDLNQLHDKVVLLESMGEGTASRDVLLRECKDAIPRLFQLANSQLSEPVMGKLLALNERLQLAVKGCEGSPQMPSGPISMASSDNIDLLINLGGEADNVQEEPMTPSNSKAKTSTEDILDLFTQQPKLEATKAPKVELYYGSSRLVVDVVSLANGLRFLRLFNTAEAPVLRLKFGRSIANGTIKAKETLTVALEGEPPMMQEVAYEYLTEPIKETLKLVIA
jgi:hypothetical protein